MGNKGFTLIELLVVIAIIGLIASVVLVNVGGLQGKARLTKTLEFSSSINNALGAYMAGYWSFDDQANPTKDASGYNNHGTLVNAPTFNNSNTPHAAIDRGTGRYALTFNGSNQHVVVADSPSLDFGTSDFTVEYWMYYTGSTAINNVFFAVGKSSSSASTPGWFSGITTYGGSGSNFKLLSSITNGIWGAGNLESGVYMSPNTWYHVVFVRAGTTLKHYQNGKADGVRTTAAVDNVNNSISFTIGSLNGSNYFGALMDEVRVYEKALTMGEIQQNYAEGLKTHQDLAAR